MTKRLLLGLSGGPGSGKSTLAWQLSQAWREWGTTVVPMDGFHLPDAVLASRGLAGVKGAPETFDLDGFAGLVSRLRQDDGTVLAPAYDRPSHAVIPNAIAVTEEARVVIVEGLYVGFWPQIRSLLDAVWRIDLPWEVTREALITRRIATGREPAAAVEWVDRVDAANHRIAAASPADLVLTTTEEIPATPWPQSS